MLPTKPKNGTNRTSRNQTQQQFEAVPARFVSELILKAYVTAPHISRKCSIVWRIGNICIIEQVSFLSKT